MLDICKKFRTRGHSLSVTTLLAVLALGLTGCPPSDDGGGGGGTGGLPVVDLAVTSPGFITDKIGVDDDFGLSSVFVYEDVLNAGSQQDPETRITNLDDFRIQFPLDSVLTEHDLYVADPESGTVLIWRDYRELDNLKSTSLLEADVHLDFDNLLTEPVQIAVSRNKLFVLDRFFGGQGGKQSNFSTILIYEDADGLDDTAQPAAIIDAGDAYYFAVVGNRLFIADPASDSVLIYNNVENEFTKGVVPGSPDIVLNGPSWLNLDQTSFVYPIGIAVRKNHLFVGTDTSRVFVFSPANDLEDQQPPDAVISSSHGSLIFPFVFENVGDTLFVGNGAGYLGPTQPGKSDEKLNHWPGLVLFDNITNLVTGQSPFLSLDESLGQIPAVQEMSANQEALFVATSTWYYYYYFNISGDVHIYREAANVNSADDVDIVLPSLKDFLFPTSIATNSRLPGQGG